MANTIQSFMQTPVALAKAARDVPLYVYCGIVSMWSASALAQSGEFTDNVRNAKAMDTTALRTNAKQGADNWGFILQMFFMIVGFVICGFGVFLIARAGNSNGQRSAAGGWIMAACGFALGALMAVFMFGVSLFTGSAGT